LMNHKGYIMRVCHLTSAHEYNDLRIFYKECCSLSAAGFEVHLVAYDAPNEVINKIRLHRNKANSQSRLSRFSKNLCAIYQKALTIDADLYHLHDPDLLTIGLLLKLRNKKVIYDAHEDIPRDILDKEWIPKRYRPIISKLYEKLENVISQHLDLIVVANPPVCDRFRKLGCKTVNINNYPIKKELVNERTSWQTKQRSVCYLGGIHSQRGIFEMIAAVEKMNIKLLLAGTFSSRSQRNQAMAMKGWRNVQELGQIDRQGVKQVLQESMAGLSILHPIPSYTYAFATKIFEYMASGIPVIASNFPLWEKIVTGNNCGICVDPLNVEEIGKAIKLIISNPEEGIRMGENGRSAITEKYNWENESKKLIASYRGLSNG
jgi:glycosyltransferase involved in cell wall biosynthesis